MLSQSQQISIAADEFALLRDFIHEKSGIFFGEQKTYLLEGRLSRRIAELGLRSFRDYLYHVKYDLSSKEFNILMNLITTNETSFFRNPPQIDCFSGEVLPMIIENKNQTKGKSLKIWSAGCSTGEEPYTLSMLLLEKAAQMPNWKIEIIANDISEQVLAAARKGVYNKYTCRTMPAYYLSKYFDGIDDDNYKIKDQVRSLVRFSHLNLIESDKVGILSGMDMVFCRNVLIYFSDEVKKKIIRSFYNSLNSGGFLFIGHAESLHGLSKSFKLHYFKEALVYRRI